MSERTGGRKNRKFGRNRAKCQAYRLAGRREANKVRRVLRDARRASDPLAVPVHQSYRGRVGASLRDRPLGRRGSGRRLRDAAHGDGRRPAIEARG